MQLLKILNDFESEMIDYWSKENQAKWSIIKELLINSSDDDILSLINYYQREITCECEFVHKSHLNFLLESIFANANRNDYLDLIISLSECLEPKYYDEEEIFYISEDNQIFSYENLNIMLDNIYLDDAIYTLVEDIIQKPLAILEAIKDVDSLIGCWEMCE